MDFGKTERDGVAWIPVAQFRARWQSLMYVVT